MVVNVYKLLWEILIRVVAILSLVLVYMIGRAADSQILMFGSCIALLLGVVFWHRYFRAAVLIAKYGSTLEAMWSGMSQAQQAHFLQNHQWPKNTVACLVSKENFDLLVNRKIHSQMASERLPLILEELS